MCVRALLVRSTLDSQKKKNVPSFKENCEDIWQKKKEGKTQKQVEGRKPHTHKKKKKALETAISTKVKLKFVIYLIVWFCFTIICF